MAGIYYSKIAIVDNAKYYYVSRENSAGLLFDFDTDLKKTLYSENFENYEGDFQTASLSGHGTVLSVPHWTEYTLFTSNSGDFDFTMLLAMENRDWGQVSVHIKEDLSFDLKGTNHTNPYMLRFVKNDGTELAKIDLNDIENKSTDRRRDFHLPQWPKFKKHQRRTESQSEKQRKMGQLSYDNFIPLHKLL